MSDEVVKIGSVQLKTISSSATYHTVSITSNNHYSSYNS